MAWLYDYHTDYDCTNGKKAKYLVQVYTRYNPYYPDNFLYSNYREAKKQFNEIKDKDGVLVASVSNLETDVRKDFVRRG